MLRNLVEIQHYFGGTAATISAVHLLCWLISNGDISPKTEVTL